MLPTRKSNGNYTLPYNENMRVAWLAKNQADKENEPANRLWEKYYETPENLPTAVYRSKRGEVYEVLTDRRKTREFTSNLTFMFNNLLAHGFSSSPEYLEAMGGAALADRAWWLDRGDLEPMGKQPDEWGTTAEVGLKRRDGYRFFNSYNNFFNPDRPRCRRH